MNTHPLYNLIQNSTLMTSLAKDYGTPLYIYSEERLLANLERLNNALKTNFNKYHICYALKANSNPALIRKMKNNLVSIGADCSSPGELHAAKLAGIDTHECIYTGNYESLKDLQIAYNSGCHLNLDDITSFHRLNKIGIPNEISFRFNPGFGKGTFPQITTAGKKAKFGVPKENILEAYRLAKNAGINKFGIQRNEHGIEIENIGIDIEAKEGSPVYPVFDGVVTAVTYQRLYGELVIIDHGNNNYSVYWNNNDFVCGINKYSDNKN